MEATVIKGRYQLTRLCLTAIVVSGVILAGAVDTALAQTSPELKFLNGPLSLRAKHGDQEARGDCPPRFSKDVETATATVFVLLSGSQKAMNIQFPPEVPAAGARGLKGRAHETLVAQNRLEVQSKVAANETSGRTIEPSEVKGFTLTFLICSRSESPGLWYYLLSPSIPAEWSNLAGQLVVRDSESDGIVPGTVALQLNRPAPGYAQTYFMAILAIAVLVAAVSMTWMYRRVDRKGWRYTRQEEGEQRKSKPKLGLHHDVDFKSAYVAPLTTATALFGTVFSTTLLPIDTFFMSKGAYAALNVLFGFIVIVAAIAHNHFDRAGSFLVAAGLTLGAAAGEIVTVIFLAKEIGFQETMPAQIVWVFQILLVLLWFGVVLLGCNAVVSQINKKKVPESGKFIPPPRRD